MSVICCIDFTGSNGIPRSPDSLHYLNPSGNPNQYQKAILSVCNILLDYDYDKMIHNYGFGAKVLYPGYNQSVSHFFPLNGDPNNPFGAGVEGVFYNYNQALQNVQFAGPTYFKELISNSIALTKQNMNADPLNYTTLVILTDGAIHDMNQTIDHIVEASELPMSIIIVGIGNADFSMMEELDGDNKGLKSGSGKNAKRDIVQFVSFNKFCNQPMEVFASHVLRELPTQVVEYFRIHDITPPENAFKPMD